MTNPTTAIAIKMLAIRIVSGNTSTHWWNQKKLATQELSIEKLPNRAGMSGSKAQRPLPNIIAKSHLSSSLKLKISRRIMPNVEPIAKCAIGSIFIIIPKSI